MSISNEASNAQKIHCKSTNVITMRASIHEVCNGFSDAGYHVHKKECEVVKEKTARCKKGQEWLDTSIKQTELISMYPREWNSFRNMKYSRCGKNGKYQCHAGIADFRGFLKAFGPKLDPSYTLDRLDSSNHLYAPGLCEWVPKQRQTENRRTTRYLTDGAKRCLSVPEWYRRTGVPSNTIRSRVDTLGWSHHDAVHTPVGSRRNCLTSSPPFPSNSPARIQGGNANECTDQTSATGCNTFEKATPLVSLWTRLVADKHDQQFCDFSAKDQKMIKQLANRFEKHNLSAMEVIRCVIEGWSDFTRFAKKNYGAYGLPAVPTLQWLVGQCIAAGNFYLNRVSEAEGKKEFEAFTMLK